VIDPLDLGHGRRVLLDVHPGILDAVFGQKLLGTSAIRAPGGAVDGDRWTIRRHLEISSGNAAV